MQAAAEIDEVRGTGAVGRRGAPVQLVAPALERRERAAARTVLGPSGEPGSDTDVQEIVDLLHNVCQVQIAAIGILEGGRFHYLVSSGTDPLVCDAADTICQHTMARDEPVVIGDASRDPRLSTSPFVDGRIMDLRFYASAPVYGPSGVMVGRLCLFDSEAKQLAPVQLQALSTLADSVSSILDLRLRKRDSVLAAEAAAARGAHDEVVSVASQVSHDLRVPLTALGTSLAMLAESAPDDETSVRRGLLASARRSADRMSLLVDGLLRLNDVQRGLEITDVDLHEATQQVLADLGPTLDATGAQVTLGPLPVVRADADLVTVCMLNLLSNAVKFSRPGHPPEIVVSARRTSGGLRISVRDNGTGIPPADRTRVFALFSRLTPTPGHGIGLTTVARVAHAHGGRVGVDDTPSGVGTDIWFELPA